MITLCMETSHVFLALGILKDGEVLAGRQLNCWKRQSEEIFPQLISMMAECSLTPDDLGRVVITSGPGSYTGVRIAMTIAKVFCSMKQIPLYTIGTLQLYAGRKNCRVILDARGHRCYTAVFADGVCTEEPHVIETAAIAVSGETDLIGDLHLLDLQDRYPDLIQNFADLEEYWQQAGNVHLVTPDYLKSSTAYLVGK